MMLDGKVAIVTGASRGIGRAIAVRLARAGASVACIATSASNAAETVAACQDLGASANAWGVDVSDHDAVAALVKEVTAELGGLHILVNNAGVAVTRGVDDLTEADFDLTIAVNLKSVFLCMQAVLPGMRARTWGRIVNISSGAARGGGRKSRRPAVLPPRAHSPGNSIREPLARRRPGAPSAPQST